MQVRFSNVPCPHCGDPICDACAFNGTCKTCMGILDRQIIASVWEDLASDYE